MFNTTFFKPLNLLILIVIIAIWQLTLGKFLTSHVEKD